MTKKCENFVIDLMHDTDSDFQMLPNPKLGSVSEKGRRSKNQLIRFLMTHFHLGRFVYETPDANEIRWQEQTREEKLDEGAITYFQEEEEE